jgi:hypothetical protein
MPAKFFCLPLIAAIAICLSGCDSEVAGPAANNGQDRGVMTPAEAAKSDDLTAKELLDDKPHIAEAKEWLSPTHDNHMLWKADRKTITQLINDLYDAGATKIWAVDINEAENKQLVATFVVELPTEKEKRTKVLDVHNQFWKKSGGSDEDLADVLAAEFGQKYLVLDFDN